jgi:pyrroloquinoline quinone (PQQ) biosynthesis protein C
MEYAAASRALWTNPKLAEFFADYLVRTHTIIRASVPLMEAARARAAELAAHDAVAADLAAYLAHHIREERHHDDWLLDDLEALGVAREQVLVQMPSPTVAALVGSQYYWIRHYHPVALLGYIAVLEGTPPVAEHVEGIIRRTGLPRHAFRTILKHADLDPHHRDALNRALDAMPLTANLAATIAISGFSTLNLLGRSLTETVDSWTRSRK